ncbi:MAG TPA: Ppx/GppA family phosphatase [Verrucomicrobiales bacterium]|nr:Ppx/GppA family phosphatase [Verrucomicrobiales bacterium]
MDDSPKNQTQNIRAIIDVGSNSVKLLIAEVAEGVVTPIVHKGKQTRLGRGVFETGRLEPEAIADTARAVAAFGAKAKGQGAASVRVLATSAAREASNADELAAAISAGGLELEIIDGQTEAELVLRGVRSLADLAEGPLAIIDVGGGSTELLVADDSTLRLQHSFPLGTVRWLETFPVSETPTAVERAKLAQALDDFLDEQVTPKLGGLPLPNTLIGAGGTPVFLARIFLERSDLAADEVEALRLSLPEVQSLTQRLWKMPLAARRELAGLPANRADVILFGAAIYEAVMMRCGFGELRPTLRGVRYGALLAGGTSSTSSQT